MSKHTPGPWLTGRVVYYIGKPDRCNVWGPINHAAGDQSGEIICELATLANARLIAAAPELLEAAQELINAFNFRAAAIVSFEGDDRVEFANKLMFKAVDKATAVIAKATGAQP